MPRDDLVFIAAVLDRSGSMQSIRDDAIGGFNAFLKEQQDAPGDALFTLVLFDDEYIVVNDGDKVEDVKPLDASTFVPRGGTALYDAMGRTVNVMEAKIASMPEDERPSRMIVATLSDGHENQSKEFTKRTIKDVIEERSKHGWDFMFLSSGLDQFAEAHEMGIKGALYATGPTGPTGVRGAVGAAGQMLSNYRSARSTGKVGSQVAMSAFAEKEELTSGGISLQASTDQKSAAFKDEADTASDDE
jgi:hypothetical protein